MCRLHGQKAGAPSTLGYAQGISVGGLIGNQSCNPEQCSSNVITTNGGTLQMVDSSISLDAANQSANLEHSAGNGSGFDQYQWT
jgi:hypothetical protein